MIAALLLARDAPAAEPSLRCQELGSACRCDETYNTNSFTGSGLGDANSAASDASIECGGTGGNWNPAEDLTPVAQAGMPTGNSVDWVWKHETANHCRDTNGGVAAGKATLLGTTKRVCIRSYQKLSADFYDNNANGGKWTHFFFDANHELQLGHEGFGASNSFSCRIVWDDGAAPCTFGGTLTPAQVLGEWVRVELCIEGDFTTETGNFYMEGYWRAVTGAHAGEERTLPYQLMGDAETAIGVGWIWFGDMYRGCGAPCFACACSESSCVFAGNRQMSHLTQAEWASQSAGLFIGAATEVEGGAVGLGACP